MSNPSKSLIERWFDDDDGFETASASETQNDGNTNTGVGVLIVKDGKILCGKRVDEGTIGGPGGHIEDDETPEEAAIRETKEEFGIVPKNLTPVAFLPDLTTPYCPSHVFVCTDYDGDISCDDVEMTRPGLISVGKVMQLMEQNPDHLFMPFAESVTALLKVLTEWQA